MSLRPARSPTLVGVLESASPVEVDGAGSVRTVDVELEWWIGAEDRWHRPAQEVAVRRQLLDGAPVVQTLLRIPGGDARVLGYGAVVAGRELTVLEVNNDSRSPVAVALVARSSIAGERTWRPDGARLYCDGSVLLAANRPADGFVMAADLDTLAEVLAASSGGEPTTVDGDAAAGAVALVFALAHGSGVRFLVAPQLRSEDRIDVSPLDAPSAEGVIRGWRRQLDATCRFGLGDERAELEAFERRCRLLLSRQASSSADISALAAFGHGAEAARRLNAALSELRPPVPAEYAAALLVAASDVVTWADDDREAAQLSALLAGPALELVRWAGHRPRRWGRRRAAVDSTSLVAHWAAKRLLARHGEAGVAPDGAAADAATVRVVTAHRAATFAGDGDGSALLALRFALVADDGGRGLDLLPGWQDLWRGRMLDVHGLRTAFGSLAFALRWHGTRPALLWELSVPAAAAHTVPNGPILSIARLDPTFVTGLQQGETLLAEPSAGSASAPNGADVAR